MNGAQLFVTALEHEGVEYIFGVPGEENLDMLEALKDSSIRLIVTRHEQAAGFMAATYGRLTGKPGVCLSTLGPGATNLVTAAAYANLGAMPMIMITGQKPIRSSKQGLFQIIDVVGMMEPITKYATQIVSAKSIPSRVREAFRLATQERPGAVHLEFPEDIAAEEVGELPLFPVDKIRRPAAEAKAIEKAARMIEAARQPILLIGAAANRHHAGKMLAAFVDKTGIPFVTTQMGKGVLDESRETYVGCTALSSGDYVHCALSRADLIINVGHDAIEKPPFLMKHGSDQQVIHINYFSAAVDDVYFPQWEVVGDIGNALWQLTDAVSVPAHWDVSYALGTKERLLAHIESKQERVVFPMIPQQIVRTVREVLPPDGIVTLDNGMYKLWFAREYPARERNTLLLDNALATMGAGLPSAMAARLVHPEKQILAVCGDGGFMMNSQDLETAVREGINVTVLILNDSGYGMIKWKQEGMGLASFGLDFGNPDFVKYAEAYGVHGYRPASAIEFRETLAACLNSPGVHLIDLSIDYRENTEVFHKELPQLSCEV